MLQKAANICVKSEFRVSLQAYIDRASNRELATSAVPSRQNLAEGAGTPHAAFTMQSDKLLALQRVSF
jgi:hypothetical protein